MLGQTAQTVLNNYNMLATERSIILQPVPYGSGAPQWNDLPHAGIPTSILLEFEGSLTVKNQTTVGTVTPSPMWPFNILGLSTLMDYQGNTRILADGWDLFCRDMVLGTGIDPRAPYQTTAAQGLLYSATIPTGVANATVTSTVRFSVTFPISMSAGNVLGSYDATVPQGNAQLLCTERPLTGSNIDSPLTVSGSTQVSLTGTWKPTYFYEDAPSNVPVPAAALAQIHEFYHGNASTDGLQANGVVQELLLTGREYYRVFVHLVANNKLLMTQTSPPITQISFLVNSSTPTLQYGLGGYLAKINRKFHSLFPFILYDFSNQPWAPNNYGSLTCQQTMSSNLVQGSYVNNIVTRETLYIPSGNQIRVGG